MQYKSKQEFVQRIEKTRRTLVELLDAIPQARYNEPGVWGDGWTICDLLAHLTEWEQMALRWCREGREGGDPVRPAPGYKWNQTPALNRAIWSKHHAKPIAGIAARFETSYQEILTLVEQLSEEELLAPGYFKWTGKYPLTTYLGPNTCSHYAFAVKVLTRWLKGTSTK